MSKRPGFWIRVAGRPAHYDEAGDGPTVIVAPGLGLSTRFYEPLLTAFARAKLRLVVPDMPGFGRTGGHVTGTSVHDLARWLVDFADALALDRPAWLGHSVGCQLAIRLAADWPERAAALVLASPTGAPVRLRLTRQLLALPLAAAREPLELLGAVVRDYVHVLPTAYIGTWLRAGRDDPLAALDRVRCPVTLIAGDRDPICRPSFLTRLAGVLPGARVDLILGGGHGLPRDSVDRFTAAATAFLTDALPTATSSMPASHAPTASPDRPGER